MWLSNIDEFYFQAQCIIPFDLVDYIATVKKCQYQKETHLSPLTDGSKMRK